MFPDALNYLSLIIGTLCAAPLLYGLYRCVVYMISIPQRRPEVIAKIIRKLDEVQELRQQQAEAGLPAPPHTLSHIEECKNVFDFHLKVVNSYNTMRLFDRIRIIVVQVLRIDPTLRALQILEKDLANHVKDWRDKYDVSISVIYGQRYFEPQAAVALPPSISASRISSRSLIRKRSKMSLAKVEPIPECIERAETWRGSENDTDASQESGSGSDGASYSDSDSGAETDYTALSMKRTQISQTRPPTRVNSRTFQLERPRRTFESVTSSASDGSESEELEGEGTTAVIMASPPVSRLSSPTNTSPYGTPLHGRLPRPSQCRLVTSDLQAVREQMEEGEITPTPHHYDPTTPSSPTYETTTRHTPDAHLPVTRRYPINTPAPVTSL